jgi:RimJ/RimL family protein N-acetyltransferase
MDLTIRPFSLNDLELLVWSNSPEMTAHVGGPETEVALVRRLHRYVDGWQIGNRMFVIECDGLPVGNVGYWKRDWKGEPAYESGWGIVSAAQGRGLATSAVALALDHASKFGERRYVHAFPAVDHDASNAVCRKSGFDLLGPTEFEYPPGSFGLSNDWRFDLDTLRT